MEQGSKDILEVDVKIVINITITTRFGIRGSRNVTIVYSYAQHLIAFWKRTLITGMRGSQRNGVQTLKQCWIWSYELDAIALVQITLALFGIRGSQNFTIVAGHYQRLLTGRQRTVIIGMRGCQKCFTFQCLAIRINNSCC